MRDLATRGCVNVTPQKVSWWLTESPVETLKQLWVMTQMCVMDIFV